MSNRLKAGRGRYFVPTTYLGPKPGDFPVGSLQSRAAARAMVAFHAGEQRKEEEAELGNLTPLEQALIEDVEPRVKIWMIRLFRNAQEGARVYGKPLPLITPEGIRHNIAVFNEIDRMTSGQAFSIHLNNSIKWNQLRAIAEENLRTKKK